MNQQEKMKFRYEIQSRVIKRLAIKRNVVNLNTHNTWQHEQIKCRIAYELQKLSKEYFTEAPVGTNFGRETNKIDVLCLDDAQAIEIRVSETEDELKWKSRKIPDCLEVISVTDWSDLFEGRYKVIKPRLL